MKEYLPRIIDSVLDEKMTYAGGIYIKGTKWVGKTTSAKRKAKKVYSLSDETVLKSIEQYLELNPDVLFKEEDCPILFDEWQMIPSLWDRGRNFIDSSSLESCKILLTGSAQLTKEQVKEKIHHSGAGRYTSLVMRPMSLWESGESNGAVSLLDLFNPDYRIKECRSSLTIEDLFFVLCRGGWPESINQKTRSNALDKVKDFVDILTERNIDNFIDFSNRRMNTKLLRRILEVYALNDSQFTSNKTLIKEVKQAFDSLSDTTFYAYRDYLDSLFILEDVESWSPLLKSKINLVAAPKKEFVDPSIALSLLNQSPEKIAKDLFDMGFYFENMVIRDLRIYSMKYDGKVYYYHDRNGLEADAVLVLNDGRYALIEIKLGENEALKAVNALCKIKKKIEINNEDALSQGTRDKVMALPSSLIVITGGTSCYSANNGVHIVPIGCLKD